MPENVNYTFRDQLEREFWPKRDRLSEKEQGNEYDSEYFRMVGKVEAIDFYLNLGNRGLPKINELPLVKNEIEIYEGILSEENINEKAEIRYESQVRKLKEISNRAKKKLD